MPLGSWLVHPSKDSCLKMVFVVLNAIPIFDLLNIFVIFLTAELKFVKVTHFWGLVGCSVFFAFVVSCVYSFVILSSGNPLLFAMLSISAHSLFFLVGCDAI